MSEHDFNFRGLIPGRMTLPVAASKLIERGNFTGFDSAGRAVEGDTIANGCLSTAGRALHKADNSSGAAGAVNVEVELGVFEWINSSTDPLTAADVGKVCFLESEATVAKTNALNTLCVAGVVTEITAAGFVAVFSAPWVSDLARAAAEADAGAPSGVPIVHAPARGVVTGNVASLAAFTVAGNDGLTYVAGDRVLLVGQTTAAECGIYVVGTVGGGTAPLTRAADMPAGAAILNGTVIEASEGTELAGSSWKAMCTGAAIVGTNDPTFYPRNYKKTITLVAGVYTLGAGGGGEKLFLFSTTKSMVVALRNTANTSTATTGGYSAPVASRIAGKAGTAAVLVRAEVAAGTLNNADISSLDVHISNW